MDGDRLRLRRFPANERCDECGARKWYQESGFRYCQRGHRLEGFVEFDLENEDGFGALASKSQRSKVSEEEKAKRRKRKARRLAGREARELYLECIQIVIRKQAWQLTHEHSVDFPEKLESIVRDLWDLRVRSFPGMTNVDGEGGAGNEDLVSSADEGTLFSSHAPDDDDGDNNINEKKVTVVDWSSNPWQLPTLAETLGIIYLACVMLRLPVGIGQLYGLAKSNKIPYFFVASQLPPNMMDNIPRTYIQTFDRTADSWSGDEIHSAVKRLLQGYHKHYDLVFPEPNWPFLLLHYVQQLALPIEIYLVSKRIIFGILEASFVFNLSRRPPPYAPNPDATMAASVVVATKHLFPFEDPERDYLLHRPNFFTHWRYDWEKWQQLSLKVNNLNLGPVTEQEIYKMSEKDLDEYVETLRPSLHANTGLPKDLLSLFPVEDKVISSQAGDVKGIDVDTVILELQRTLRMSLVEPEAGQKQLYNRFREPSHLQGPAKLFHERVCHLSGLKMETLLKTVLAMERRMERWATEKKKQGKEVDMESEGGGDWQ